VDVDYLYDVCKAAVAHHSILKTVFVRAGDMIVQAMMQSPKLSFNTEKAEKDLSMYCDSVWKGNCAIGSTVNQVPLRFTLMSQSPTRHVFIMRYLTPSTMGCPYLFCRKISAWRIPAPLSQTLEFCSYMHYRALHDHGPTFCFWRNYLHHIRVQRLPFRPSASPLAPSASLENSASSAARIAAAQNIPLPNPPRGITTANLVGAATAWVMHRHGSPTDLILGQTITGRSIAVPGIDTVLGVCLNFIPFRVTLPPASTIMDLLKHVQQQSSITLSYVFMDFSDIVRHCSNWPQETRLP
jgi:hypothetical protein